MQPIYRHSDQHLEVYTTVLSPQVCRSRTRTKQRVETDKVVVAVVRFQSRWPKELDLNRGDLIQVLFKDEFWWFGRLAAGDEGYFPAACVEPLQACDWSRVTPPLVRRGSVPVIKKTTNAPCGCTSGRSTPKLLGKHSIWWPLDTDGPSAVAGGSAAPSNGSPSLLHRVLAKSRRKSCPLLHQHRPNTGAINAAFQPD